jgi:hypothetical protein
MLIRVRRWIYEFVIALLASSFVFYLMVYQAAVPDRPRAPVGQFVWPYASKFGVFYVSQVEGFVLADFFFAFLPLCVVVLLLKESFRGAAHIAYDPNAGKVLAKQSYEGLYANLLRREYQNRHKWRNQRGERPTPLPTLLGPRASSG